MTKFTYTATVDAKRPQDATPDKLRKMRAAGMSVKEIARLYDISRSRVYQLFKQS